MENKTNTQKDDTTLREFLAIFVADIDNSSRFFLVLLFVSLGGASASDPLSREQSVFVF